jgi:uncharacterized protein
VLLLKKPLIYVRALGVVLAVLLGFAYFSSQNNDPDPLMVELGSAEKKTTAKSPTPLSEKKDAHKDENTKIVSHSDKGEKKDAATLEAKDKTSPGEKSQQKSVARVPHTDIPAPLAPQVGVVTSKVLPPQVGVPTNLPAPQDQGPLNPDQIASEAASLPIPAKGTQASDSAPKTPHEVDGAREGVSGQKATPAPLGASHNVASSQEGAAQKTASPGGRSQDEPYVVSLEELNKPTGLTSYEEAALLRPGKIVLMLIGLGRQEELSHDAVALPKEVALAFHEGPDTIEVQKYAHEAGHETFVMVPMEPIDYPKSDPGPMPLLTGIPASENIQRLASHLKERTPCTGVVPFLGSRFMFSAKDLSPILTYLHEKGLLFVDTLSTHQSVLEELSQKLKIPNIAAHICLGDREMDKEAIDERLVTLEKNARLQGHIIVFAWVRPAMLFCLEEWVPTLSKKNIQLISFAELASIDRKAP